MKVPYYIIANFESYNNEFNRKKGKKIIEVEEVKNECRRGKKTMLYPIY